MAKDPAMLWYWGDWNSGTSTMTRHMKGCYIDLLHAQFNSGPLSLEEIKVVLGADFATWGALQKKFKKTESGSFFNERLELEKNKRAGFTKSRRENIEKRYKSTYVDTSVEHMNVHMENENRNTIDPKEGLLGGDLPRIPFHFDLSTPIPAKVLELAEMNQHTLTGNSNSEFIRCQWKLFLHERLNDPPIQKAQRTQMSDITSYFLNWIRNKHPKKNGTHQQSTSGNKQTASAYELLRKARDRFDSGGAANTGS